MPLPTWPDHRCAAVHDGRRCQLLEDHQGDHAHVPADVKRPTCTRWDATGREWVDPGDGLGSITLERLRWAACGYRD